MSKIKESENLSLWQKFLDLKYQRFTSSSFKDTGIMKYMFEKNSQFLHEYHLIHNYWFKIKGTLWYEYFTNSLGTQHCPG